MAALVGPKECEVWFYKVSRRCDSVVIANFIRRGAAWLRRGFGITTECKIASSERAASWTAPRPSGPTPVQRVVSADDLDKSAFILKLSGAEDAISCAT